MRFFDEIINFDFNKVEEETFIKVRFMIIDERLSYEKVKKESQPAAALFIWLLNIIKQIEMSEKFSLDNKEED